MLITLKTADGVALINMDKVISCEVSYLTGQITITEVGGRKQVFPSGCYFVDDSFGKLNQKNNLVKNPIMSI